MSRLPNIDTPQCEHDVVSSYLSDRAEIRREVAERHAAKKLADRRLNELRTRYAKERDLFTPGVDFAMKLLEDLTPESAIEWLRGFDVARQIVGLDAKLTAKAGVQPSMFEEQEREAIGEGVANATA